MTSGAVEGVALVGAVEADALGAVPDPPDGITYVDCMQICDCLRQINLSVIVASCKITLTLHLGHFTWY